VHALEQFYYDEYDVDDNLTVGGTNIGLSIDEKNGQGCYLYIYYKNGTANITRGKYLKNVEIVGSVDEKSSYDMARYKAMSMGEDIINLSAALFNLPQNRYDASNETVAYKSGTQNSYPDSCMYLVASYQDDVKGAIGAVKIAYQDGETLLPATMSAIIDYTGKSVSFTKGNSVAPRIKDAGSDKIPEGYVLYKTSSGEAIGRIGVQEDGRTGYDGTGHYFTYLSDQSGKIFAANGGYEQMVLLYSAVEPKYISSIMISEEGYFPEMQLELNQLGYHQFICTDIMAGNCLKRYHIAIARTANPMEAIKDILIVDHDMGKETTINDRVYTRVNDTNLINGYTYTGQVFIYTTKGNELERGEEGDYQYAERVAITNIGLRYKLGKLGDTVETYWNGSNLDTIANVTPSSITDSTRILIVPGMDKDGDFTKNGILNGNTYQESRLIFGMDPAWTEVHGESYLVFTTNSGYSMLDYEEGYKENIFTGTKTGDEKLGLGTVVSDNSLIVSIVVILVGASVVASILIFGKKKKSVVKTEDDADE
ncbi:MAG: hypothetical protein MJ072_02330, partial [Clostridia bacterium]|nr:hypothetical protein [Clostridia bacterium]